jgi:hypothetical protein
VRHPSTRGIKRCLRPSTGGIYGRQDAPPFSVFRLVSEPLMPKTCTCTNNFRFTSPSSHPHLNGWGRGATGMTPSNPISSSSIVVLCDPRCLCAKNAFSLLLKSTQSLPAGTHSRFTFFVTHTTQGLERKVCRQPTPSPPFGMVLLCDHRLLSAKTPPTPPPLFVLNVNQSPVCTSLFNHFPSGGQDTNPPPFGCFPLPALGHRSRTERGQSSKFFPLVFDFKLHYFQGPRRVFSFPPLVVLKVCSARRSRKNSDSSLSLSHNIRQSLKICMSGRMRTCFMHGALVPGLGPDYQVIHKHIEKHIVHRQIFDPSKIVCIYQCDIISDTTLARSTM